MTTMHRMHDALPDLRLLRCFIALVEEHSVTRAAARLGMTQSAMSHALGRLRRTFGDPLLVRGREGSAVTARAMELEGPIRDLLDRARTIAAIDAPFDPARSTARFIVMAAEYVEYLLAARVVERLRSAAPSVTVEFRAADRDMAPSALERGELDFRIGWWPSAPQSLRQVTLFSDRLVVVVRSGHPAIRGTLSLDTLITTPQVRILASRVGVSAQMFDAALARTGRRPPAVVAWSQNAFTLARVVAQTDCAAFVAQRLARELAVPHGLQILEMPLDMPPIRISLYWHERMQNQPAHRWFRGVLRQVSREIATAGTPQRQ
jgi:DNA-binding transcriptional LysR family regulator